MILAFWRSRVSCPRVAHTATVLSLVASLSACGEKTSPPVEAHPVLVTTVQNVSSESERTFAGVVRSRIESEQGFRTGGKVIARMVEVGQTVVAGQALARLDAADYELAVRAAEDQWQAARVDAEQAATDEARLQRLLTDHSVSIADYERQKARADAAAARQAQASRQLDLARNRTKYATLVAEFDGVITSIRFEVGQVVAEGMPVITVAKPTELEVVADLPEEMAGNAGSLAASATSWDSQSISIPLKLRELSPAASATTRTFRARFTMQDKSPATRQAVHLGMTTELHLTQKEGQLAAVLPAAAVWKTDGKTMIWQVDSSGSKLAAQPVDVIRYTDEAVLVRGLADGTRVVSAGIQKMTSGLEVAPIERSANGMNLKTPEGQARTPGRQQ